jgi:hypothetical protein
MDKRMFSSFTSEMVEMTKEALPSFGEFAEGAGKLTGKIFSKVRSGASGVGELIGHPGEVAGRLAHPLRGMKEGWNEYSPVVQIANRAKKLGFNSPQEALSGLSAAHPKVQELTRGGMHPDMALDKVKKEMIGHGLTGARHPAMLEPSVPLRQAWQKGGLKGTAEELSRRGWTGETKYTKYLPVGGKSWIPGMSAMAIPGIVNAPPPSPSGENGRLERGLGEVGSVAGMALTGGLGVIPGTIGWALAQGAGSRTGRVLDRLRAGATVEQAVHSPSPTEAANQLDLIRRTYG